MLDQILFEIHLRSWLSLRSKRKSCTHRLEEVVSSKFLGWDIYPILKNKDSFRYKLFEESLHSSWVRISEKLTHLIEWLIDSSSTEKVAKYIYLFSIIFIRSHSVCINLYTNYIHIDTNVKNYLSLLRKIFNKCVVYITLKNPLVFSFSSLFTQTCKNLIFVSDSYLLYLPISEA